MRRWEQGNKPGDDRCRSKGRIRHTSRLQLPPVPNGPLQGWMRSFVRCVQLNLILVTQRSAAIAE